MSRQFTCGHVTRSHGLLGVIRARMWAQEVVCQMLILALLFETGKRGFSTAFRLRDTGACNTTSNGSAFAGGYYGSRMLKAIPVPSNYKHTHFTCWYSFRGVDNQRLMFEIRQLDVGMFDAENKRCQQGHLRLWDGLSRVGQYWYPPNTLCGHYPETSSVHVSKYSTGPNAEIEYVTKANTHHTYKRGFILTFKYINVDIEIDMFPLLLLDDMTKAGAAVCDWTVQTEKCHNSFCDILSPGHPGIYPPNMQCHYHVFSSDPTSSLQISFKDFFTGHGRFNITSSTDCVEEHLAVYNGDSPESALIGRFCGSEVPDITIAGGHIFLQFITGTGTPPFNRNGFHATVLAITKEWNLSGHMLQGTLCDWLFNRSEGSVSSPDHWMPADTTCTYTLQSQPGFYMQMLLAIYGLSAGCEDSITVCEDGQQVDRICEDVLKGGQSRFQYHLEGKILNITYHITNGQLQSRADRGFWLSFRQIRGARKYPMIIHLKDEAARYTVDELHSSGCSIFCYISGHIRISIAMSYFLYVVYS